MPRTITTAGAYSRSILLVMTMETRAFEIDPFARENRGYYLVLGRDPPFSHNDLAHSVVSITRYRYPDRDRQIQVALSAEGEVGFFGREEGFWETIPDAGLDSEGARGYGYLNAIRQVGPTLFACGQSGQVYEREAPGRWRHIDQGVLNAATTGRTTVFEDVNGPSVDSLYLVGQKGAAYFRGKGGRFRELALPTSAWLQQILVVDEKTLYICGQHGTLLVGNAVDGFKEVARGETNETLLSMAMFEGRLYLASTRSVYALDGQRLTKVTTRLRPDLADAHVLDAVDGVLWSVGYMEITRFDGQRWERFDLPGNPPIR